MSWKKSLKCGLHFKGISTDCKGKSSVLTNGFPLKRNTNIVLVLDKSDDGMGECCDHEKTNVKEGAGLRKMVRELNEELEKERLASATAAEETMAMIMRLQNEKSMILMESKRYRLMAEKKHVHDKEVIQSLRRMVKKHESAREVMENRLRYLKRKLGFCLEGNNKNNLQWVHDDEDDNIPFHTALQVTKREESSHD